MPIDTVVYHMGMRKPATRLSALVRRRGHTAASLAKATGYAIPTVYAWTCGRRIPHKAAVISIAAALGVSVATVKRATR